MITSAGAPVHENGRAPALAFPQAGSDRQRHDLEYAVAKYDRVAFQAGTTASSANSLSSRIPTLRPMRPMPQQGHRVRQTTARRERGSTTTRVITPAAYSTPTATASNLFSKVGSTFQPDGASYQSGQRPQRLTRSWLHSMLSRPAKP